MLGRPLLAIAPKHMAEQQVNARLAERDGFAIAAAAERVDVTAIRRFEEASRAACRESSRGRPTLARRCSHAWLARAGD